MSYNLPCISKSPKKKMKRFVDDSERSFGLPSQLMNLKKRLPWRAYSMDKSHIRDQASDDRILQRAQMATQLGASLIHGRTSLLGLHRGHTGLFFGLLRPFHTWPS
ncbi:hypothetical protein PGT21_024695 [Puccinia graminis f. sp. tritici]|uniref:Uncharacterized protein n=1 Tax=Puccinia graminis f. sp. tritici TaxID=56615 RepID=A0A5B0LXY7_PUCGR|nr:hypothetical protein PGTUg99_023134 [Puccinia graminis f. sp. tritici]KAA1104478.1 hypothetical protein PGT21_024695 [Puccinia graminis f. sp. tritici]